MKEKRVNYYKISTIVLICIIVVFGGFFGVNYYNQKKFQEGVLYGEQIVVQNIMNNIQQEGYVTFTNDELSLSLVPLNTAQNVRENTILEIMNLVQEEGYVSLYTNESEVILVPYVAPEENIQESQ